MTHPAIPLVIKLAAGLEGQSSAAWLRDITQAALLAAGRKHKAVADALRAVPDDWLTSETTYQPSEASIRAAETEATATSAVARMISNSSSRRAAATSGAVCLPR